MIAAVATAAVLAPVSASAQDIQVGVTPSPVISPTCPANAQGGACKIVLTQATAYETLRDGVATPDMIQQSGEISSFTLGLTGTNTITPADFTYLDKTYGGPPEAQLTILRPVGRPAHPVYRVAAQSPIFKLRAELGEVAEFPLTVPLPVVRGEMVALTVPTWAPVLSIELDTTKFSYTQSRMPLPASKNATPSCTTSPGANIAQLQIGQLSNYGCSFPGNRVEYSALEITTPLGFSSQSRRHRLHRPRAAATRRR